MMDSKNKFSGMTVLLHWTVGLTILCLLGVGIYMAENEVDALYPIHKSFGVLIFPVILLRAIWRFKNGWPVAVTTYSKIEQIVAKVVHWLLLTLTILMPVTGMMFSGASGHGFGIFSWQIVPSNPSLTKPGEVDAFNPFAAHWGHELHEIFGYVLLAAICLHVVGVLKHKLIDKDASLARMLGKNVE